MSALRILGIVISLALSYCALFYGLLCFGIYSYDSSIANREAGVIVSFVPFLVTFGIVVFCFYTDETPFLKALIRGGLAELCVCVLVFGQAFMLEWSWSHTPQTRAEHSIVGTWQRISVDQQAVTNPFFMRFYPDGTVTSWPAPDGWPNTNGVSHGRYHFEREGTLLCIETGEGRTRPKLIKVEMKKDEITMIDQKVEMIGRKEIVIDDKTNRFIYHRVVRDLQPGEFPPRQVIETWPNKSPEPTAVGAVSSDVAVNVESRRWLSFLR